MLPAPAFYTILDDSTDRIIYEDIGSLLVRLVSFVGNPWRCDRPLVILIRPQWTRGNQDKKITRIDFAIREKTKPGADFQLVREVDRGKLSYCGPCEGCWHIPIGDQGWIIYQLLPLVQK